MSPMTSAMSALFTRVSSRPKRATAFAMSVGTASCPVTSHSNAVEPILAPLGDNHGGAVACQFACGGFPDTATGPGDDGHCSIESFCHASFLSAHAEFE